LRAPPLLLLVALGVTVASASPRVPVVPGGTDAGTMDDAGASWKPEQLPRLAVRIRCDHAAGDAEANLVPQAEVIANTIIETWKPAGFRFVDPEVVQGSPAPASDFPTHDEARAIMARLGADVLVAGTACTAVEGTLVLDGDIPSMKACRGRVSVRAYRADTGEILAVGEVTATALHRYEPACRENALIGAAKKLREDFMRELIDGWTRSPAK
jgi:hypothetical protein